MGTRIVRHLRLRGSDEAVVRHIALRLEDALRTASLPEAGGRLVLVRRLALGRIPRDAAPQTLALSLERHLAALVAGCLPAGNQNADAAPAVYFRDTLEAHAELALRLLAGAPVDAWFWPLAVPAWQRGMPVAEALRRLAYSLAARPEAPVALPLWAAALVRAGHGEQLVVALGTDDVPPLARAAGIHRATPTDETPAAAPPPAAGSGGQRRPAETTIPRHTSQRPAARRCAAPPVAGPARRSRRHAHGHAHPGPTCRPASAGAPHRRRPRRDPDTTGQQPARAQPVARHRRRAARPGPALTARPRTPRAVVASLPSIPLVTARVAGTPRTRRASASRSPPGH